MSQKEVIEDSLAVPHPGTAPAGSRTERVTRLSYFLVFARSHSFRSVVLLFAFVAGGLLLPELHRYEHIRYADEHPVSDGVVFLDGDRAEFHECVLCEVRLVGIAVEAAETCLSVLLTCDLTIADGFEEVVRLPSFYGRAPPAIG